MKRTLGSLRLGEEVWCMIMAEETKEAAEKVKKAKEKPEDAMKKEPKKEMKELVKKEPDEEESVKKEGTAAKELSDTLKFVHMTEKAIRNIEKENKLVFIVDRSADKSEIKNSVEAAYSEKVTSVNTLIDQKGRKKATVKFAKANAAGDIAVKLGII